MRQIENEISNLLLYLNARVFEVQGSRVLLQSPRIRSVPSMGTSLGLSDLLDSIPCGKPACLRSYVLVLVIASIQIDLMGAG